MTLVERWHMRSTAGEVEISGVREMLRALRAVGALVPKCDVLKRAMPVQVESVRPSNARSGKFVRRLVEASTDCLPGEEPTMLLRVGKGLFHLRVQGQLTEAGGPGAVANSAQVVPRHAGRRSRDARAWEDTQCPPAASDFSKLRSDGTWDGYYHRGDPNRSKAKRGASPQSGPGACHRNVPKPTSAAIECKLEGALGVV